MENLWRLNSAEQRLSRQLRTVKDVCNDANEIAAKLKARSAAKEAKEDVAKDHCRKRAWPSRP